MAATNIEGTPGPLSPSGFFTLSWRALGTIKQTEEPMPLRDHFRSPVDDVHSWDELHGGWPMMIVRKLIEVLPEPYFAAPGVHLGTLYEVDVGTYRDPVQASHGPDG